MAAYFFTISKYPSTPTTVRNRTVTEPSAVRSRITSSSQTGPMGMFASLLLRRERRTHSSKCWESPSMTLSAICTKGPDAAHGAGPRRGRLPHRNGGGIEGRAGSRAQKGRERARGREGGISRSGFWRRCGCRAGRRGVAGVVAEDAFQGEAEALGDAPASHVAIIGVDVDALRVQMLEREVGYPGDGLRSCSPGRTGSCGASSRSRS
jgi:hypothetical protein